MSKKKNTPSAGNLPAIRIGSRVRCTDDGVEGRISWCNAVVVKIKWDDGEEVTWKRAELASKPIEFLDTEAAEQAAPEQADEAAAAPVVPEQATEQQAEAARVEKQAPAETTVADPQATEPSAEAVATQPAAEPAPAGTPDTGEAPNTELPGSFAIPKRQRKPKTPTEPKEKKLSALDAAAKVLAETGTPMTCKELIGTMAAKGYWTSPGGQTPDATLHSAILREVAVKGEQSRFVKTGPGRFTLRPTAPAH
jgi:hypothetical protein